MARPSKYSPELRRRAVIDEIERGRPIVDVVRDLGIGSPQTLSNWVKQTRRDAGLEVGPTTEELAEIKRLRTEVADQQRTIEILRAASSFFGSQRFRVGSWVAGSSQVDRRRAGNGPGDDGSSRARTQLA